MSKSTHPVAYAVSLALLLTGAQLLPSTAVAADAEMIAMGKKVAVDRRKGNCLACHMMDDGQSPGDIGPPLIAMQARFPDRAKLRTQLVDPMASNPNTRMPPFGKHRILTEQEIDAIVAYLYTL